MATIDTLCAAITSAVNHAAELAEQFAALGAEGPAAAANSVRIRLEEDAAAAEALRG